MKSILLLYSMVIISTNCFCQLDELVLTAKSNGYIKNINEGSKISAMSNDGTFLKGRLGIETKSQIIVGNDNIFVNEIQSIRYSSTFSKTTGGLLFIGGGVIMSSCIYSFVQASNRTEKTNFNPIPVVGLFCIGATISTGGILKWINGKKYKNERWNFSLDIK